MLGDRRRTWTPPKLPGPPGTPGPKPGAPWPTVGPTRDQMGQTRIRTVFPGSCKPIPKPLDPAVQIQSAGSFTPDPTEVHWE